jgi:cell division septation protein DedD
MSDVRADAGRIGDRREQLVSRAEEPADVGTGGTPDAVPESGDRRIHTVHTVPIRADQGTANSPDRPASRSAAAPQSVPMPPPAPRQAAAPAQPASPPLQRQAAVAPPETPAAAPVESGGFMLQLFAVRSEDAAQTEFRRMQSKYSSVLSGRQPLIRRKDRGEQGIFYVAQIGPFGAKSEAEQLCGELKAAGGTCIIQRN